MKALLGFNGFFFKCAKKTLKGDPREASERSNVIPNLHTL